MALQLLIAAQEFLVGLILRRTSPNRAAYRTKPRRKLEWSLKRMLGIGQALRRRGTTHQKLQKSLVVAQQAAAFGALSYSVSREFREAFGAPNILVDAMSWLPVVVRGFIIGGTVAAIYLAITCNTALRRAWLRPHRSLDLACHYAFWAVLFGGASRVPRIVEISTESLSWPLAYYLCAPFLWLGYIAFGLKVVAAGWGSIPGEQNRKASAIWTAVIVASAGWRFFERWQFPNATKVTDVAVTIASWFSALAGNPIRPIGFNENGWPIYQTGDLTVVVAPTCAGLEGVFLTTLLLMALVVIERRTLHLERALGLIIAAAALTFLGNALRLAALFYIGDHWSAEVAVNGFHTNFGIVSLVIITSVFTICIRLLASRENDFDLFDPKVFVKFRDAADVRLAMPQVVFIAASLTAGLFAGEFNWLYPVPVFVTIVTLHRMGLPKWQKAWSITARPLVAGVIAFFAWVLLIPPDLPASGQFAASLLSIPAGWAGLWLLVRLVGSAIVVPITEELAFRAFLISLITTSLAGKLRTHNRKRIGLLLSSVCFGLMHSQIFAGILAGIIFGHVYQKRGNVLDAMFAHALTNFLLFGYAMWFQYWSYL